MAHISKKRVSINLVLLSPAQAVEQSKKSEKILIWDRQSQYFQDEPFYRSNGSTLRLERSLFIQDTSSNKKTLEPSQMDF